MTARKETAADRLRRQASRVGSHAQAKVEGEETEARPAVTPPRAKPVRITVDLSPADYRSLSSVAGDIAAELELPKVAQAEVVRALINVLADDARVRALTQARIRLTRD